MKKKLSLILENTFYFKVIYLLVSVCSVVPFVTQYTSHLFKLILLYAFLILLNTFFVRRRIFKSRYFYIIGIFLGALLISTLVNFDKAFYANIKTLGYLAIQFFILAYIDFDKNSETVKREIFLLNNVSIIAITIISMASFFLFMFNINGSYVLASGAGETTYYFGVAFGNRLTGITGNPNTLGILTLIGISGVFINTKLFTTSKKCKRFYTASVIINFICFIMASSRGAELGYFFFGAIYLFFKFLDKIKCVKGYVVKSIASLLLSFTLVGCLFFTFPLVRQVLGYIPPGISVVTGYSKASEEISENESGFLGFMESKHIKLERELNNEPLGGGRISLWNSAAKIIQKHLIFGVGKGSVSEYARLYSAGANLPGIDGGSMHNIIIETVVSYGIIGLLTFLLMLSTFARDSFLVMYSKTYSSNYFILSVILSPIIMLFANNMVESSILYSRGFMNFYFMIYLGYLMYFLQLSIQKNSDEGNIFKGVLGGKWMNSVSEYLSLKKD